MGVVCFCGGGSGGHLQPNYALSKQFEAKGVSSFFVVPNNEFDVSYCKAKSVDYFVYSGTRFYQGSIFSVFVKLFKALLETHAVFLKKKPSLVVGTGGYGSFPVYLYCVFMQIPFFMVEPNKICGKVNRWFALFSTKVFTHFEDVIGLSSSSALKTGNPIWYEKPVIKKRKTCRLLVFGASQGAEAINSFMGRVLKIPGDFEVYWITGALSYEKYRQFNERENISVVPFCNEMPFQYCNSDLVLGRAGAGTVAEIEEFKVPAVFVPYPHHKDRQQFLNCEHLVSDGSCLLWEEKELDKESVLKDFLELLDDKSRISAMSSKFSSTGSRTASELIVDEVLGSDLFPKG
jgi:UDP-N-acetylglucosamine--N-acetylmuramyl-(pentapeptide) pyrophosphoryl-undecaprenol N-acetylglucosamine transferase